MKKGIKSPGFNILWGAGWKGGLVGHVLRHLWEVDQNVLLKKHVTMHVFFKVKYTFVCARSEDFMNNDFGFNFNADLCWL